MKRLLLVFSLLILTACSSNKIPEGFTETELTNKVNGIVSLLNDNKVNDVYSMFRSDVQAMLKLEDLEVIIQDKFEQVGTFKEVTQIAFTDTKDPSTAELYAVVIVVCEHEEGKTTYTLSFNEELELVGFFVK